MPLETAMQEAEFKEIGEYFLNRQNTDAQYITMWHILNLYEYTVRMPGVWVSKMCQEQYGLDLAGKRAATASAEGEEGRGEKETEIWTAKDQETKDMGYKIST